MVRIDVIKPFSTKCGFARHKNFPNLFRHEWKSDNIIFDLLTAIVLFTPRPGLCEYEKTKYAQCFLKKFNFIYINLTLIISFLFCYFREEHLRYIYLLRRYLEIKYPTIAEAKESFSQLMSHIEEMRQLNADIMFFFRSYSQLLQTSPLFTQLLDLDNNQPARPSQHQNTDPFGVPVFDDPNMYSLPEVNQQQMNHNNNMGQSSVSSTPSSSNSLASTLPHQYAQYGQNTMDSNNCSTGGGGQAISSYSVDSGANSNPANQSSSSSPSSSSNAYRECIINSAN